MSESRPEPLRRWVRIGAWVALGWLVVAVLTGCSAPSPSPFGGGGRAPRATITPTIWPPPLPTPPPGATPLPTPTLQPDVVTLGEPIQIGAWEVVIAAAELITASVHRAPDHPHVLLDLLAVNRSAAPRAWPFGVQPQTLMLVDASGVTLDTAPLALGERQHTIPARAAAMCAEDPKARQRFFRHWEHGASAPLRIPPGMGMRIWTALTAPPGTPLDRLSVIVRVPPTKTEPAARVRVQFAAPADASTRPHPPRAFWEDVHGWNAAPPPVSAGAYRIQSLRLDHAGEGQESADSCQDPVAVTMEIINYDRTVQPAPSALWLVDYSGRYYRPLDAPRLTLDPGIRERLRWLFPPPLEAPLAVVFGLGESSVAVRVLDPDDPTLQRSPGREQP